MKKYTNRYTKKNSKGLVVMSKAEQMSNAITNFIMTDEFMMRFIIDNVREKIYNNQSYDISMIEDILINDLDTGNTDSYLIGFIIDEIDVFQIAYRIHDKYGSDFYNLARQCKR